MNPKLIFGKLLQYDELFVYACAWGFLLILMEFLWLTEFDMKIEMTAQEY